MPSTGVANMKKNRANKLYPIGGLEIMYLVFYFTLAISAVPCAFFGSLRLDNPAYTKMFFLCLFVAFVSLVLVIAFAWLSKSSSQSFVRESLAKFDFLDSMLALFIGVGVSFLFGYDLFQYIVQSNSYIYVLSMCTVAVFVSIIPFFAFPESHKESL